MGVSIDYCEVCDDSEVARYKCPRCLLRSCSLNCVLRHKKERKCNGIRSRAKFVRVKDFSELELLSDYRLLEEVARTNDSFNRDKLIKCTWKGSDTLRLPLFVARLRNACRRRQIRFLVLPPSFDRRRINSSRFFHNGNVITWKVELVFPHADQTVRILPRVDEKTKLCDIVKEYVDVDSKRGSTLDHVEDPFYIYRAVTLSRLRFLLKAEGIHKIPRRFYELDYKKSLLSNLRGKTVVENPIIYVTFASHKDYFDNEFDDDIEDFEKALQQFNETSHRLNSAAQDEADYQPKDIAGTFFGLYTEMPRTSEEVLKSSLSSPINTSSNTNINLSKDEKGSYYEFCYNYYLDKFHKYVPPPPPLPSLPPKLSSVKNGDDLTVHKPSVVISSALCQIANYSDDEEEEKESSS